MWILDTSIAVKWFFNDEPGHAEAVGVLSHIVENPEAFAVPSLFFSELPAVLIRKSKFEKQFVIDSLKAVYQLGIPSLEIGQELSDEGISMACYYQVSADPLSGERLERRLQRRLEYSSRCPIRLSPTPAPMPPVSMRRQTKMETG